MFNGKFKIHGYALFYSQIKQLFKENYLNYVDKVKEYFKFIES